MGVLRTTRALSEEEIRAYREAGYWDDRRLRDGIEAAATDHPTRTALVDRDHRLDHATLARSVDRGLTSLREAGLRAGDAVVLVTGNVVAGVVAYHAALRQGLTTIVLDRRCGPAELRHALALAPDDTPVIVSEDERARLVDADDSIRTLPLAGFGEAEPGVPQAPALDWDEPDRDAPAVILFTSGTTSRPKAVIHSLNTLTAGARNMARITGTHADTVVFLVSPLASITGIMQMHLVADAHAALALEDAFDDASTLDRINTLGATLLGGAPVIAERLLRAADARDDRHVALRTLALGGAMLPRPLLETATRDHGIEVARVYGSSESPNATGSVPEDPPERRLTDDGLLMPGTEVRVGSRAHPREGLLRGPALFLGYVDPQDTEAAFEDGWYRTGDAVEVDDGRLTVTGRLKDVVNRNGLKISLAAIEEAVSSLPGAHECACFGLPDTETGERLAVAIRPEPDHEVTLESVVAHLTSEGIATRSLPEELVVWDEPLPRTASGKIVRSRLIMESAGKTSFLASRLVG